MQRYHQHGISLIEMLIVVAALSLLMSSFGDGMSRIVDNNRMVSEVNQLVGALSLTRSEAIKRRRPVIICRSDDAETCAGAGDQWGGGWIIFVDLDNDETIDTAPVDERIRIQDPLPSSIMITANLSFGRDYQLTYKPDGSTLGGNFCFTDPTNKVGPRRVGFSRYRRPSITRPEAC